MKRRLELLVIIVLSLTVTILFIEGAFRLFPGLYPPQVREMSGADMFNTSIYTHTPDMYRVLKPNIEYDAYLEYDDYKEWHIKTIDIGGLGWRDDGIDSKPYILALGDSMTFGWGVEEDEIWTEILESKLGKDVVNMGVPRGFPSQAKLFLERYGMELEPEIVFYQFHTNDFDDERVFDLMGGDAEKKRKKFYSIRKFLNDNFITYHLIKFPPIFLKAINAAPTPEIPYSNGNLTYTFHSTIDNWGNYSDVGLLAGEQKAKEAILEIKDMTEGNESRFIMILLPPKELVYIEDYDTTLVNVEYMGYPHYSMLDFCSEQNITCIDMLQFFQEHKDKQLYIPYDGHLSVLGNELFADHLKNEIEG